MKKIIVLLAAISWTLLLAAQGKVTVVDDEECGCELHFVDGIQTIERDGLFGFKLEDGTVTVEPQYKYVDKYHGNWCRVYRDDIHCGMIDRSGKVIIPCNYEEIEYPSDGLFRVRESRYYGFIDTTGVMVIPMKYRAASTFSEGKAVVGVDIDSLTFLYGYIDQSGAMVIKPHFEYAYPFKGGFAPVVNYERYGMIDTAGREVVVCKYGDVTQIFDGTFFVVDIQTEKAALFNDKMKQLTGFIYEKVLRYSEGLFVVRRDGKETYLNLKGKECNGYYDQAGGMMGGYAMVKRDGKYGIINRQGKIVLPIEYDNSGYRSLEYHFTNGLAMIEKDGRYGFCDRRGNIVIPVIYQSAQHCTEDLVAVQRNGLWGYLDKEGNDAIEFVFDAASYFEYGRAEVVYHGVTYKINPEGKCVKNCRTFPKIWTKFE